MSILKSVKMSVKLFMLLVAVGYVSAISFTQDSLNRISNSPIAVDNQFPYAISLQQISELPNQVQSHRCGGALITLQHALTLASCVTSNVNNVIQLLPAAQYRVYAGGALLSAENANRIRSIANFAVHSEYIPYPASLNDIAIITLTQPFLNTTVFPIPLPLATFDPLDFTVCTLTGWGASNSNVVASNELRYTSKYVYNQERCTNLWNQNASAANIFLSMICATSYDIISSGCSGDHGNALVCSGQLTGLLFLTNNCEVSSYPEVYTRVSNYTTWIRGVTGAASTFRPELSVFVLLAITCMKIFS